MKDIEVAFKLVQDKNMVEDILLKNGFVNTFKNAHTRDLYFGKNINFDSKSEEEIKQSLIRCRGFSLFENLNLYDKSLKEGKISLDFMETLNYINRLIADGYVLVFDTTKSDWIYKKGNYYHQLQEIEGIGLLDYVYLRDKSLNGLSLDEQFELIKKHVLDLGIKLEYDLGVDKLRSLYYKKLMFSKNQISKYTYQKK